MTTTATNLDFIEVYPKLFNKEWCEQVIQYFEHLENQGFTLTRKQSDGSSSLDKKDTSVFSPSTRTFHSEYDFARIDTNATFLKTFWEVAYKDYETKYPSLEGGARITMYELKMQKTEPMGGYHLWHYEKETKEWQNRILAWTLYLNDDFEAGETEFLYQQRRIVPEQGTLAIWPAGFTHLHRGNPPINGTKYIATGWVEFA